MFSSRAVFLGGDSVRGWVLCKIPGEKPRDSFVFSNKIKNILQKRVIFGKMILVASRENNRMLLS